MDDVTHLQALLKDRDCACPACGYNLRGLTGDTCPECGKTIDPSAILGRRDRVDYAWLIMLLSFTAALPWSVLFVWQRLIIQKRMLYGDDWNPSINDFGRGILDRPFGESVRMLASCAWWLSVPFVCFALISLRRKITRWPRTVRWLLAAACLAMLILALRRWQWWWWAFGLSPQQHPYPPGDFWFLPWP